MNKRSAIGITIGITLGVLGALLVFLPGSGGYLAVLGLGFIFGSVVALFAIVAVLVSTSLKKRK